MSIFNKFNWIYFFLSRQAAEEAADALRVALEAAAAKEKAAEAAHAAAQVLAAAETVAMTRADEESRDAMKADEAGRIRRQLRPGALPVPRFLLATTVTPLKEARIDTSDITPTMMPPRMRANFKK